MKTVTLTFRADDIESALHAAAYDAAMYGAKLDYCTRKIQNAYALNGRTFEGQREEWQRKFLKAKRIVEAFGVEYEQTSEQETLTVTYDHVTQESRPRKIAGMVFNEVTKGYFDYDNPRPCYRREVHIDACSAAAKRTVRKWRATLEG